MLKYVTMLNYVTMLASISIQKNVILLNTIFLYQIFVERGREDKKKWVEYVYALGKTAAHTNISV